MKYMGSKSRIAKDIVPIIQNCIDRNNPIAYLEPFVGGANVIDKVKANVKIGSDSNQYLIALFNYIKTNGGDGFPDFISREEYSRVRSNKGDYPLWYVGLVGFLASYNGRFFDGGYAGKVNTKSGVVRDYYDEAKRNLLSQAKNLKDIYFSLLDYRKYDIELLNNYVIYCDPPYKNVKKYDNSLSFNHDEFWEIMRLWSKNNKVIISEQEAPDDFMCIWKKESLRTIDNTKRVNSVEKLFIYNGSM